MDDIHIKCTWFVTRLLIGLCQKFATVYPAIYCRKQFDVINYVIFPLLECGVVYGQIYVRKSRFTATVTRHCKTKFPSIPPLMKILITVITKYTKDKKNLGFLSR